MSPEMKDDVLKLAAILRLADGLDYSRMDSRILGMDFKSDPVIIEVRGPGAETDASRADAKCDLWRLVFGQDLCFKAVV